VQLAANSLTAAAVWLSASAVPIANAQSLEPRSYANIPVGTSFLILGYSHTRGGVAFDTSVPVSNPHLNVDSGILAYARAFDLAGSAAKFDVVVPVSSLEGAATNQGAPVERAVSGFGDPAFRLSWNFHGSPALTARQFASYRQDLLVGASVQVSVPVGQYDPAKLVNLGANRWFVKPEIGVSKALGPWTLEGKGSVTFFSGNDDFFGGNRRTQEPLYAIQGNVIRDFGAGRWMSVDATYFAGGRNTLNGTPLANLQQNWRVGLTLAMPVDAHNALKLAFSRGVSARTGNNYDLFGIFWQHAWSAGL
jgi:hypothetical protein